VDNMVAAARAVPPAAPGNMAAAARAVLPAAPGNIKMTALLEPSKIQVVPAQQADKILVEVVEVSEGCGKFP
jgi:hypothetical protein